MPELPEVEIAARNLRRWALGRTVVSARCDPAAARMFRPSSPRSVQHALVGARFERIDRRGKNLLFVMHTPRGTFGVVSHLGMTGKWVRGTDARALHVRVRLALDDGTIVLYRDPRMFGRLRVLPDARFETVADVAALGPDPLIDGVDPTVLAARLAHTARSVKLALMDQSVLAGLGNIQVNEALFVAGIDPRRAAKSLTTREVRALATAIVAVLTDTIAREESDEIVYLGESGAVNIFRVYDRAGERCPRCGKGSIARVVQGGRASFYCRECQS